MGMWGHSPTIRRSREGEVKEVHIKKGNMGYYHMGNMVS